jgi:LPXTG-motif cell wall-anchored protein
MATMAAHMGRRRLLRRAVGGLLLAGALIAAGPALASPASAGAGTTPVTDYATYPEPLPAGCPDGPAALVGLSFDNGRGGVASDLRQLSIRAGDTVTMSWTGFASGCATADGSVMVGLALYTAQSLYFDHTKDESLTDFVACGGTAGACGGQLQMSIPATGPVGEACFFQLDAHLGRPLGMVGPSGSYYNSLLRGDGGPNLLVSAHNFAVPCALAQAPTTTPVAPATTTPPAAAPTTTAPSAVSPAPTNPAPVAPVATTPTAQVLSETANRPRTLPATGSSSTWPLTLAAVVMGGSGVALIATSRRIEAA